MAQGKTNEWTEAQDNMLRRLHSEGIGWEFISQWRDLPVHTCMDRARKIGLQRRRVTVVIYEPVDDTRCPLPPGHPTTWGSLTNGTVLDGVSYER